MILHVTQSTAGFIRMLALDQTPLASVPGTTHLGHLHQVLLPSRFLSRHKKQLWLYFPSKRIKSVIQYKSGAEKGYNNFKLSAFSPRWLHPLASFTSRSLRYGCWMDQRHAREEVSARGVRVVPYRPTAAAPHRQEPPQPAAVSTAQPSLMMCCPVTSHGPEAASLHVVTFCHWPLLRIPHPFGTTDVTQIFHMNAFLPYVTTAPCTWKIVKSQNAFIWKNLSKEDLQHMEVSKCDLLPRMIYVYCWKLICNMQAWEIFALTGPKRCICKAG